MRSLSSMRRRADSLKSWSDKAANSAKKRLTKLLTSFRLPD